MKLIGGKTKEKSFRYFTLGIQILSQVLEVSTSLSLIDFANKYLFEPLDIETVSEIIIKNKTEHMAFYKSNKIRGWIHNGNTPLVGSLL